MATQVQTRRGSTAEHSTFTGAVGELTVDTTKDTVVVHDGSTAGGAPLLREDGSNSALALGSAASPSLKFTGDTNTGIYSPGADQLAISTNGTGRLFVDASGNTTINGICNVRAVANRGRLLIDRIEGSYDSPTAVTTSAEVGAVLGRGYDGASYRSVGSVSFTSDGAVGSASSPGFITFGTTQSGSNTPSERLRITSAGLVGIGTSSPDTLLHIESAGPAYRITNTTDQVTTNGDAVIARIEAEGQRNNLYGKVGSIAWRQDDRTYSSANAVNKPTRLEFCTQDNSSTDQSEVARMVIDFQGKVGIGTTSPFGKLHVQDDSSDLEMFLIGPSSGSTRIRFGDNADTNIGQIIYDNTSDSLQVHTNNAERARIDSSGRLLVGTSSARATASLTPSLQLESTLGSGAALSVVRCDNSINGSFIVLGKSRSAAVGGSDLVSAGDALGTIRFAGADGVDLNSIAAAIDVNVDGTPGADDMPGRLVFSTTADGASSPTTRLTIASNGDFRVANTGFVHPVTDNAVSLGLTGFRWSAVWAANGTIQTSDQRAKADITNATLGSDFIKALRPVSYKWIEGGKRDTGERDEDNNYIYESVPGERTHWGFVAQEVKQAVDAAGVDFGGWVLTDKDDPDSQQALRYDQFIAPLTKALQEALAEIDVLKAKVAALESA